MDPLRAVEEGSPRRLFDAWGHAASRIRILFIELDERIPQTPMQFVHACFDHHESGNTVYAVRGAVRHDGS